MNSRGKLLVQMCMEQMAAENPKVQESKESTTGSSSVINISKAGPSSVNVLDKSWNNDLDESENNQTEDDYFPSDIDTSSSDDDPNPIFNCNEEILLQNDNPSEVIITPPCQQSQVSDLIVPCSGESTLEPTEVVGEIVHAKKRKCFKEKVHKSRKRSRNEEEWKKRKAALARQAGEEYISQRGKLMPAKLPCESILCHEKCRLNCSDKFNNEQRYTILSAFYKLDINAKNALLFKSIVIKPAVRKRKGAVKHKSFSYEYSVTCDAKCIRVCKTAICSLYNITKKKVDVIQEKLKTGQTAPSPDKRGRHLTRPHAIPEEVKQYIMNHIKKFPVVESHYSRHHNPHKMYLCPLLNINKMYKLYIEECKDKNKTFLVQESSYRNIFSTQFNLSFGQPRSDTCSTCDSGRSNEEHKENASFAFQQQRLDREKAYSDPNICYLTVDLQQTMPLPRLTTSKAFYLRQMWFYNLGVHTIMTEGDKPYMYTWTEDIAGRGSAEVASSLWTFLQMSDSIKTRKHLIIWSDSCSGQNKNFNIVCLYQLMILKGHFDIIDHKFPEVGHSYLDSDRDFGRIEKVLRKHETVYTPEQYRDIIRSASTSNTVVVNMEHHFRCADDLPSKLKVVNKKKNFLNQKVNFRDGIKWIRVEEFGSYLYKETYDEYTPFHKVSILKHTTTTVEPEEVILERRTTTNGSLSAEKINNLKEQLQFIPEEHQWFYSKFFEDPLHDISNTRNRRKVSKK